MVQTLSTVEIYDAPEEVLEIYQDIELALRLTDVPWLFKVLGVHPKFLEVSWNALKPLFTDMLDITVDEIRATALQLVNESLPGINGREVLKGAGISENDIATIAEHVLVHHYVTPKLALIATALRDALAGKPPETTSKVVMPSGRGIPPGMPVLERAEASDLSGELSEYASAFSLAAVPDLYISLAKWPDALKALWSALKEGLEGGGYQLALSSIESEIGSATKLLRRRMDLGAADLSARGIPESEQAEIRQKAEAAALLYRRAVGDAAYVALAVAGPEDARLTNEGFMLRWQLP